MISPIDIATSGYLCGTLSVAVDGYLCLEEKIIEEIIKKVKKDGGSDPSKYIKYKKPKKNFYQLRKEEQDKFFKFLQEEDEEIIILIKAFLNVNS